MLSIDLSLASTGIAIFNDKDLIHYEKIITKKIDFDNEDIRMNYIGNEIENIIIKYQINTVVCESQFTGQNSQTILKLRKLLGVICRVVYEHKIVPRYYIPSVWRKILGINKGKNSDKKKLAYEYVVNQGIELGEFKTTGKNKNDDITDAIAIGMAYIKENCK